MMSILLIKKLMLSHFATAIFLTEIIISNALQKHDNQTMILYFFSPYLAREEIFHNYSSDVVKEKELTIKEKIDFGQRAEPLTKKNSNDVAIQSNYNITKEEKDKTYENISKDESETTITTKNANEQISDNLTQYKIDYSSNEISMKYAPKISALTLSKKHARSKKIETKKLKTGKHNRNWYDNVKTDIEKYFHIPLRERQKFLRENLDYNELFKSFANERKIKIESKENSSRAIKNTVTRKRKRIFIALHLNTTNKNKILKKKYEGNNYTRGEIKSMQYLREDNAVKKEIVKYSSKKANTTKSLEAKLIQTAIKNRIHVKHENTKNWNTAAYVANKMKEKTSREVKKNDILIKKVKKDEKNESIKIWNKVAHAQNNTQEKVYQEAKKIRKLRKEITNGTIKNWNKAANVVKHTKKNFYHEAPKSSNWFENDRTGIKKEYNKNPYTIANKAKFTKQNISQGANKTDNWFENFGKTIQDEVSKISYIYTHYISKL